jgi:GGDEF domain-containing protein
MMGYKWGTISAIFGIATYITFAVLEYYETPMLYLVSDNLLDVMRLFCWIYTWIICVGGVTLYNMTISNLNQEINTDREELRRKATFDEDTGIYTRNAFVQILKEKSENMKPGDKRLALIYMDFVSTTASNMVAKAALRDILQDMQNSMKDTATFSRYGGLSLTALIESDQDREGTVNMIREIYDDLSSQLDPEQVEINAGAVLIPDFSTDLETITQGVRKALHLAKDEHSGVVIYSRGIGETDEEESRARILRFTFDEIMARTTRPGHA